MSYSTNSKRFIRITGLLLMVFVALSNQRLHAQDSHDGQSSSLLLNGTRSSPFDPGEENDTRFIVDVAPGLDTRCTFRNSGPLLFDIEITRYIGPINADGTLKDIATLIANGVISETATLRMPAFDVDFGANVSPPFDPERDEVFINGKEVGLLNGLNNIWILNTFTVKTKDLKFPPMGGTAKNTIRIDIDVENADIGREIWCTAIDWAELTFKAARPVLLVHGLRDYPTTWTDKNGSPWFTGLSDAKLLVDTIRVGRFSSIQSNSKLIASKVVKIRSKYGVDKINIVGHSKGGLDSREYINDHDDIEQLIMIGTPNAGSPLADFAQGAIILGAGIPGFYAGFFLAPAGAQLTTFYMNGYNKSVGENNKTKYRTLAGNDDPGGGFLNLGPDGAWYLLGEDDWIVQVESVHALPYAVNRTFTKSSPNKEARHTRQTQSSGIFFELFHIVTQFGASGAAPKAEPNSEPKFQLARAVTTQPQRTSSSVGLIMPREVKTHDVIVENVSQAFFQCIWGEGNLDIVLIAPDGTRTDSAAAPMGSPVEFLFSEPLEGIKIKSFSALENPTAGTWTLEITGTDVAPGGEGYAVGTFLNGSEVFFSTATDKEFYRNNDPVKITANLTRSLAPITGVPVTTRVMLPDGSIESFLLFDDGTHGDLTSGDGEYTNSLTNTAQSGLYRALVTAAQTGSGAFSREEALLISVASSRSEFDGSFGDAGFDSDGDGLFNELNFDIGVDITKAGNYCVAGELLDNSGKRIGDASATATLGVGSGLITLSFDGFSIFSSGADGPYSLVQLTLVEKTDSSSAIVDFLTPAHTTTAYSFRDFQRPAIFFPGNSTDFGTDTDGNSRYNILTVDIEVDVAESDFYQWSANLIDSNGTVIDFAGGAKSLSSGVDEIRLVFDGNKIGANEVNGPYVVTSLLMFGIKGSNVVTADVASTQDYNYNDFETSLKGPIAHAWCDQMEIYAPGSNGAPAWIGSGNSGATFIDNSTAYDGSQSMRLFGQVGGCWGGIEYRSLQLSYPFSIEMAVKNGSENIFGCHAYRGAMEFKLAPDWTAPGVTGGFVFLPNGDFWPRVSGAEVPISGFALDVWHVVRGEYSTPGDDSLHVKYWVDGTFVGEFATLEPADIPLYLGISAQEGTAWFDEVCVTPDNASLFTVVHPTLDALPGDCDNIVGVDAPRISTETWQTTEASIILGRNTPLGNQRESLTVAVGGSAEFDVSQIDLSTVRLQGVFPIIVPVLKDMTSIDPCSVSNLDGILDAVFVFDQQRIVNTISRYADGDEITLSLVGQLYDGQPIEAKDIIKISVKEKIATVKEEVGFVLGTNFPNPFNPSTKISLDLPVSSHWEIAIYNIQGQLVDSYSGTSEPGVVTVEWDGSAYASGVYFYKATAGDFAATKKMVLLK